MSSPLPRSAPRSKARRLSWMLAVAAALLLLICGLPMGFARYSDGKESRESDNEIGQYLTHVQRRDHAVADAMLCGGDDTGVAELPGMNGADWHLPGMESFTIVRIWDWSSVIDGHGKGYQVRLVFTDGSTTDVELAVEVIAGEPCIATEIPF
ncbi:hypothetical protein WEI85_38155 [Actinomycetes bacterium KLBMP 9797]